MGSDYFSNPVTYLSSGGKVGDKILAVCFFPDHNFVYLDARANLLQGGQL